MSRKRAHAEQQSPSAAQESDIRELGKKRSDESGPHLIPKFPSDRHDAEAFLPELQERQPDEGDSKTRELEALEAIRRRVAGTDVRSKELNEASARMAAGRARHRASQRERMRDKAYAEALQRLAPGEELAPSSEPLSDEETRRMDRRALEHESEQWRRTLEGKEPPPSEKPRDHGDVVTDRINFAKAAGERVRELRKWFDAISPPYDEREIWPILHELRDDEFQLETMINQAIEETIPEAGKLRVEEGKTGMAEVARARTQVSHAIEVITEAIRNQGAAPEHPLEAEIRERVFSRHSRDLEHLMEIRQTLASKQSEYLTNANLRETTIADLRGRAKEVEAEIDGLEGLPEREREFPDNRARLEMATYLLIDTNILIGTLERITPDDTRVEDGGELAPEDIVDLTDRDEMKAFKKPDGEPKRPFTLRPRIDLPLGKKKAGELAEAGRRESEERRVIGGARAELKAKYDERRRAGTDVQQPPPRNNRNRAPIPSISGESAADAARRREQERKQRENEPVMQAYRERQAAAAKRRGEAPPEIKTGSAYPKPDEIAAVERESPGNAPDERQQSDEQNRAHALRASALIASVREGLKQPLTYESRERFDDTLIELSHQYAALTEANDLIKDQLTTIEVDLALGPPPSAAAALERQRNEYATRMSDIDDLRNDIAVARRQIQDAIRVIPAPKTESERSLYDRDLAQAKRERLEALIERISIRLMKNGVKDPKSFLQWGSGTLLHGFNYITGTHLPQAEVPEEELEAIRRQLAETEAHYLANRYPAPGDAERLAEARRSSPLLRLGSDSDVFDVWKAARHELDRMTGAGETPMPKEKPLLSAEDLEAINHPKQAARKLGKQAPPKPRRASGPQKAPALTRAFDVLTPKWALEIGDVARKASTNDNKKEKPAKAAKPPKTAGAKTLKLPRLFKRASKTPRPDSDRPEPNKRPHEIPHVENLITQAIASGIQDPRAIYEGLVRECGDAEIASQIPYLFESMSAMSRALASDNSDRIFEAYNTLSSAYSGFTTAHIQVREASELLIRAYRLLNARTKAA